MYVKATLGDASLPCTHGKLVLIHAACTRLSSRGPLCKRSDGTVNCACTAVYNEVLIQQLAPIDKTLTSLKNATRDTCTVSIWVLQIAASPNFRFL